MSNYAKIYWLTRLDSIQGAIVAVMVISILLAVTYYLIMLFNSGEFGWDDDDFVKFKKRWGSKVKIAQIVGLMCMLFITFIPSKEDAIIIYAGGKTMDFVQSDSSVNKIPAATTKMIYDYLNNSIKEATTQSK